MQTLSDIRDRLQRMGRRPNRRLGQCFLVDLSYMTALLEMGDLSGDSTVLEIGPGTGSLTEELLARCGKVVAVEVDRDLAGVLEERFARVDHFTLVTGDVLASKSRLSPEVLTAVAPECVMVSNLPYAVATPVVAECMIESWRSLQAEGVRLASLTFTVQQEVADRFAAGAGGDRSDYGPVSVLLDILGRVTVGKTVPAGAFWPRPKVDSRIVRVDFDPDRAGRLRDVTVLRRLLGQLFTQRRKHVIATAKARNAPFGREPLADALNRLGIDPATRVEQLSPEVLLNLANELS